MFFLFFFLTLVGVSKTNASALSSALLRPYTCNGAFTNWKTACSEYYNDYIKGYVPDDAVLPQATHYCGYYGNDTSCGKIVSGNAFDVFGTDVSTYDNDTIYIAVGVCDMMTYNWTLGTKLCWKYDGYSYTGIVHESCLACDCYKRVDFWSNSALLNMFGLSSTSSSDQKTFTNDGNVAKFDVYPHTCV